MSLTRRLDIDVCYCAPRPTRLESRRPLARLWLSDFGPQDPWFIPPPSRANSHPQHRQASQPDRTPASVSPFSVVPSRSIYAETDWAPVVLLGSRLGIRSDKPVSCRTHFPLLPLQRLYSRRRAWTRGDPEFRRRMDEPQDSPFISFRLPFV